MPMSASTGPGMTCSMLLSTEANGLSEPLCLDFFATRLAWTARAPYRFRFTAARRARFAARRLRAAALARGPVFGFAPPPPPFLFPPFPPAPGFGGPDGGGEPPPALGGPPGPPLDEAPGGAST